MLYGTTGRPNFSVARLLGLCLLQELNNLSDQQARDTFSFDIRWRYALGISQEEEYLSRRSLVEFRRRLAAKDPELKLIGNVFDTIRDSAIKKLGLSVRDQRLDSTHIIFHEKACQVTIDVAIAIFRSRSSRFHSHCCGPAQHVSVRFD